MNIWLHKLEYILDVSINDTVHQEPFCFARAIECLSYIDKIYVIGVKDIQLTEKIWQVSYTHVIKKDNLPSPNDIWLLWGGWHEVINVQQLTVGHSLIALHRIWSAVNCHKITLSTDERFPFRHVIKSKWGHVTLYRPEIDKPIIEITQCLNKTSTIFAKTYAAPLFLMPCYAMQTEELTAAKQYDLVFPTRDFHKLSDSRLKKIVAYHTADESQHNLIIGDIRHLHKLTKFMKIHQYKNWQYATEYAGNIAFNQLAQRMSKSYATVVIGDDAYEHWSLIPNKLGEALQAGVFAFIDNDTDKEHRLFGDDKTLEQLSYVNANDVRRMQDILLWFKHNPEQYISLLRQQRIHIKTKFNIADSFHNILVDYHKTFKAS
jgi:hypothetical protein